MTYQFNLEWNDLPEELREQKIDDYLRADLDSYRVILAENQVADDPSLDVDLLVGKITEEDVLEELHLREEAEMAIEAHFPVYF